MSGDESVIGIYKAKVEHADMTAADIVAEMEREDFDKLSCSNVWFFELEAQELVNKLENGLVTSDSSMRQALQAEFNAGARVLRVAPTQGKHVKLFVLESLL